ncbi:methyltransferase [Vibrio tetraodonis]|uniref:methyltransferase n=1 Tax=Vibrio tetraodonis TaxID=2231647 RepID=UPI000E0A13FB|nr:methyltransferase [Vibrio tetraodonis]
MNNAESAKKLSEIMMMPLAAKTLSTLAELGVADLLKEVPLEIDALAHACNADQTILLNMFKVVELFGFFSIDQEKIVKNSPSSELLISDHPQSMRHFCMLFGDEYYRGYEGLHHTCKTGQSGFKHVFDKTLYQYLDETPTRASVYDLAMRDFSRPVGTLLANVCAELFSQAKSVIDIGGGSGVISMELVKHHQHLTACIFDRQDVCQRSSESLPANIKDRIHTCTGDFFADIPEDYDVYVLKNVLHNWNAQSCQKILNNISQSLKNSRLLVIEPLVEPEENSPRLLFNALFQSVICEDGTYQRCFTDLEELFSESKLKVVKTQKLPTGHTVIELIKTY